MLFFLSCRTLYRTVSVLSFVMYKTNTNGILLYVFFRMQFFSAELYATNMHTT